jgi:hypothetical protein
MIADESGTHRNGSTTPLLLPFMCKADTIFVVIVHHTDLAFNATEAAAKRACRRQVLLRHACGIMPQCARAVISPRALV